MPTRGATVVVLHPETREVLLHKREDFRVWALPGGGIENGESWEEAAVRETFEETGYRIRVERLSGEYRRPQMPNGGGLTYVAIGHLLDIRAEPPGWESVEVGWFPADALPASLHRFGRIYIADALSESAAPIQRTLSMPWHQAILLRLLFGLRDLRNHLLRR